MGRLDLVITTSLNYLRMTPRVETNRDPDVYGVINGNTLLLKHGQPELQQFFRAAQATESFDPFFTTKEVGKVTELELSISYGIIKEYQGEIQVVDTGPTGTTFKVKLPIDQAFSPFATEKS